MPDAIREQILAALGTVIDPDLHKDLVSLNMIRDLEIADGQARFRLVLTTAACPVKDKLRDECHDKALAVPGISAVEVTVDAEVPKGTVDKSTTLPGVKHVIAVASGKGGVGKSTVTVNLACALQGMGARVGLMDADIYGPSIPTMMGINREPYVANKKMIPIEAHGVRIISIGFLVKEREAMMWRGPMLMGAIRQFIVDVEWGELDYLLVDMPPGTGDVQMSLAQTTHISGAVVVTTPQTVALMDVRRGLVLFEKLNVPVLGVVENMSRFICPQCGHAEAIFGEGGAEATAAEFAVPFLGGIPLEPSIRISGDEGAPVVLSHPDSASAKAFTAIAQQVARQASIHAMQPTSAAG